MKKLRKKIKSFLKPDSGVRAPDKIFIIIIAVIVVFGLMMLSSASAANAYAKFGNSYYYFYHQLIGLGVGIAVFFALSKLNYHFWRKYAVALLFISVLLLLLVFIPGLSAHYGKARSWINVFGFSLQPSEFVKISFLIYLAAWLERRKDKLHDFAQGIGPFVVVLLGISFLMLLQPDLGTLFIIATTSLIVYFAGGGKMLHLLVIILLASLSLALLVHVNSYQIDRFKCMADPSFSPNDICYQINQSLIAIGSGGWWGRGIGESRQKFMYLPEVVGDSIFAVIAEEVGFIFSVLLVFLYIFLFYRGILIAKNAPDDFGRLLTIGIVTWIAVQAVVNIGGMIGFMPMTGVPLPLISYGGSAMLASLAALGIVVNISKHTKK